MWEGNQRFRILEELGRGGAGVVYRAWDRRLLTEVAVKVLLSRKPAQVVRFKREFREFRTLAHPNLIRLEDLFFEAETWFYTMELVPGVDPRVVFGVTRPDSASDDSLHGHRSGDDSLEPLPGHRQVPPGQARELPPLDAVRLRGVVAQVALALEALHGVGKIHRDVKPQNVLVTANDRVVLLDYGLVAEVGGATTRDGPLGTPAYMSPEQALGGSVGLATDWYALGVMLFELLTGRLPPMPGDRENAPEELFDPARYRPGCPSDLRELCLRLLHPSPSQRPTGPAILEWLGHPGPVPGLASARVRRSAPVVGRDGPLTRLLTAYDERARSGGVVWLLGESGIGKSALLRRFVDEVSTRSPAPMVLRGRCHEHENVPYNGWDSVIDALASALRQLPETERGALLSPNTDLLQRVFPALGRVPGFRLASHEPGVDTGTLRTLAFSALQRLFVAVGSQRRLLIVLDDMQWFDADSRSLLAHILAEPIPGMLLVGASRPGSAPSAVPAPGVSVDIEELGPLDPEAALDLAEWHLGQLGLTMAGLAAMVATGSAGHPFFVGELARYAVAADQLPEALSVEAVVARRTRTLSDEARQLLGVVCVGAAPASVEVLRGASGLDGDALGRSLFVLQCDNWIRVASSGAGQYETYHDRVREGVLGELEPTEIVAIHRRLAAAMEGSATPAERVIYHLEAGGLTERAAARAEEVADALSASFAFDRAADLYWSALRLGAWEPARVQALQLKLGGALASAGRSLDAARVYRAAATSADPGSRRRSLILAMDNLLQAGRLADGLEILDALLYEYGQPAPRSRHAVLGWIVWYRLVLWVRGLGWQERHPSEISEVEYLQLQLYRAASRGLILADPILAAYFVVRGLLLSLRRGVAEFVNYFLLIEGTFRCSTAGSGGPAFAAKAAARLKHVPGDVWLEAALVAHEGVRAYVEFGDRLSEARDRLAAADQYPPSGDAPAWERSGGRLFELYALRKLGDLGGLKERSRVLLGQAERRGNLLLATMIRRIANLVLLAEDSVEEAREVLRGDIWREPLPYHMQDWEEFNAGVELALYTGEPVPERYLVAHKRGIAAALLDQLQGHRVDTAWLLARVALAGACPEVEPLSSVERHLSRIGGRETVYTRALSSLLRACVSLREHRLDAAASGFRDTIVVSERAGMALLATAARFRLAAVVGGADGGRLAAEADDWARRAGVRRLDRFVEVIAPVAR